MKDSNFLARYNGRQFWQPMSNPSEVAGKPPSIIVGGEGVKIRDLQGRELIDAVGGLWNVNLGYSCSPIKEAITKQLENLPYYSAFRGSTNDKVIELAFELMEFFSQEGMARAFFTSGGSDSVETGLKLARQYHKLRGEPARTKFISMRGGYHGTHFGGASVNGNARFREAYEPLLPGCYHIPAPNPYRNAFGVDDPEELSSKCAAALDQEIVFQGPGTVAAFIMEPIIGAGGVIPPHKSFMPMVREVCDRHGVLLLSDEVITGFGRTGAWCGARLWDVKPDMMLIAKGITSGYFPFGGTLVSEKIAEAFESGKDSSAFIGHGYTYSGHPVGAAAGIACLEETRRLGVHDNARERGRQLYEGLLELKDRHQVIGDVRGGYGLMGAVEMVSDRTTKKPLSPEAMDRIHDAAYDAGVMVRISGANLLVSPPLIISSSDVQSILDAVDIGLAAA